MGFAGKCSALYVRTNNAQPGTGSFVFTVMKNGVATAVTLTIAANGGAGSYSDTTHSFTFAQGDEISVRAVNNASGASAKVQGWSLQVEQT